MNKTGLASLIIYSAKTNIDSTLYRFLLTRKNCFAHSPLTFTSLLIHLRRQRLSENWTAHTTVTERLVALVAIEIGRLLIDHNSLGDASVTANRNRDSCKYHVSFQGPRRRPWEPNRLA